MNVKLKTRAFADNLADLPLAFAVDRYSHSAFGGPKLATIQASGEEVDLWELMELLRSPVEIWSDLGDCAWWGYVADIQLQIGQVQAGVSIDEMYNRVAVAYSYVEPGTQNVGERRTTAWAVDAVSIAEYGTRELLQTISGSTDEHAESARTMLLAQKKYPRPTISFHAGNDREMSATLTCRGWYETLDWKYYGATSGTADTAAQAAAIATGAGQFFTAVVQGVTSGILTSQYRDGDGKASYEMEELLKMGTVNNRRMLVSVDQNRVLRIYEEPTNNEPYLLTKDGTLRDPFDTPVRREVCPPGVWVRLKDVIPASVDTSRLADPTLAFIDEVEYVVADDRLYILPRDIADPWQIGRPRDG